jgi:hypothetical protein
MVRHETEDLDTHATNGHVAGIISRYWKRQGCKVEIAVDTGPVRSNLRYGLPPEYRGEDAIPLARTDDAQRSRILVRAAAASAI